jgi:hypothetical protein
MEFDVAEFLERLARIYRCENQLLANFGEELVPGVALDRRKHRVPQNLMIGPLLQTVLGFPR